MDIPNEVLDYALGESIDTANIHYVENEEFLDPTMLSFRRETGFNHCVVWEKYLVIAKNSTINNSIVYTLMDRVNFDILVKILGGKETLGDRLGFCNIKVPPPIIIRRDTPEERKPDSFKVNWDFFEREFWFEDISKNPEFLARIEGIAELSARMFWHSSMTVDWDDISIRAFLNSWAEDMREQERVYNSAGMLSIEDIVDFRRLFAVEPTENDFKRAVLFTLWWFQQLVEKYASNGFMGARDAFRDMIDPMEYEDGKMYFDFPQYYYQDCGGHSAQLVIDLARSRMHLKLRDYTYHEESRKQRRRIFLSEYFDMHNPFLQHSELNFLFPMWYRWFIFPFFNVDTITLKQVQWGDTEKQYHSPKSGHAIIDSTATIVSNTLQLRGEQI